MTEMPTRKLTGSLIERADELYGFGALFGAAPIVAEPEPEPVAVRVVPVHVEAETPLDLAVAPDVEELPPRIERRSKARIDRKMLSAKGLLVPDAPVGALAEEFRLVKRQLLGTARKVAATDPAKARAMLVCSAKPNDGKTFCAINLAISIAAERDVEVLLIDADFAKPDVMEELGLREGRGLLDMLGDPSIDPETCVVPTDIPQLSLLPVGAKTNSDTELLASKRTGEVIATLLAAKPNRLLIFDSPPALAASPAAVLASHAGQVMLVVRADRTAESDLREAVALLDGCDEIQLVLNAVTYAPGGRRYGGYYGQENPK
ncbi:P-loop NTPase family protein [Sphingomonas immobilis]|uniref:Exopolysaccharide biosynthesis protein n=1 Tax=Sphingomonas immobilis TaxID=3063997 RepID=A0ABT9A4L9_9SPHN|nr:exopolysaccharide biosynthesis protein [Sphingomonas sp. CA1-15]MDO7844294.1 exopolysaccharide biosynthesis protein [Sphingomonas sp. CA1-15]